LESVARAWLDNPASRAAITEAVANADELFAVDPLNQGESREWDRRVVIFHPLVFTIRVDEARRVVRVLNIRHQSRRGSH
jgi:hypothetical protein